MAAVRAHPAAAISMPNTTEGSMKRVCTALALAGIIATTIAADGLPVNNKSGLAGSGSPGKYGVSQGHVKPLPPFVEKRQKERIAAADLVARGLASPDA